MPSEPPDQKRLRRAVLDALLSLVKLTGLFIPEIVVGFVGMLVGLTIGIVAGVGLTALLFSGPGAWARAGEVALLLPLTTSLGPPLVGAFLGAVLPSAVILIPHGIVVGVIARNEYRDRYVVLWVVAVAVWLPAPFFAGDGLRGAVGAAMVLSPLTAGIGFSGAALILAVRGLLAGRSIAQFWRDADGSMVLAMVVLTVYAVLVAWFACVLFCLLPTVPLAQLLAMILAVRLSAVGRHRGLAVTSLLVNAVHLALFILVFAVAVAGGPADSTVSEPDGAAEPQALRHPGSHSLRSAQRQRPNPSEISIWPVLHSGKRPSTPHDEELPPTHVRRPDCTVRN